MSRIRQRISRWLLRLARSRIGGRIAAFACAYAPWMLPVRHVLRTKAVVAFVHPRPEANDHVVLVPRRYVPSLPALVKARRVGVFSELVGEAARLAEAHNRSSDVLAINVGGRQEVLQLHGHLLSPSELRTALDEIIDEQHVDLCDAEMVLSALQHLVSRIEMAGEAWGGSVLIRDLKAEQIRVAATVSAEENRGPLLR